MGLLAIPFPDIDPVAIAIGPVAIKWYGLSYMAGLLLGWIYIKRLISNSSLWQNATPPFPTVKVDDLLVYMTVGVIIGGRLGYVFLYEPGSYLANPSEIYKVWNGGMAFHGALIGCGITVWAFARRNGYGALPSMDATTAAVSLGLIFGRLANFVNGELWGRPTDVAWGMVFPSAANFNLAMGLAADTPRHPSQLYESALEGLLLFIVIRYFTHHRSALKSPGFVTGVFLVGYGLARSFCELFRQPDLTHAFTTHGLTPGIVYSIPMVLLGVWFIWQAKHRTPATT